MGGNKGIRTLGPCLAKAVLYQLSYIPCSDFLFLHEVAFFALLFWQQREAACGRMSALPCPEGGGAQHNKLCKLVAIFDRNPALVQVDLCPPACPTCCAMPFVYKLLRVTSLFCASAQMPSGPLPCPLGGGWGQKGA